MIQAHSLKQLDLSSNSMGGDSEAKAAKKIAEMMVTNQDIVHVDFSHNNFNKAECQLISEGMTNNHTNFRTPHGG